MQRSTVAEVATWQRKWRSWSQMQLTMNPKYACVLDFIAHWSYVLCASVEKEQALLQVAQFGAAGLGWWTCCAERWRPIFCPYRLD